MPIGFVHLYAVTSDKLKATKLTKNMKTKISDQHPYDDYRRRRPDMPIGFVHLYAVTSDKLKVTKPTGNTETKRRNNTRTTTEADAALKCLKYETKQRNDTHITTDADAVLICLLALFTHTRSPVIN